MPLATSTLMRISTNTSVFHRITGAGDLPTHDIDTTDLVAKGMGSNVEFELESDVTVTHVDASQVFDAGGIGTAIGGSAAISDYIYIKNTGFTTSDKDTATTFGLMVGLTTSGFPNSGFTLNAGESITLHGLAGENNDLAEFILASSSGDIYVEIKYL